MNITLFPTELDFQTTMGVLTDRNPSIFFYELPNWLLGATVSVPVLFGAIGYLSPIGMEAGNTRLFLSALAGAQASVLAIVFAVTILGIQLATTRYAPRMIPLFVKAPVFQFTFSVFIISIALDFILLYNIPATPNRLAVGGVFLAAGMAVVSAISLQQFIPRILERGTPDGLINAFKTSRRPSQYLRMTKEYTESSERADHPLQPLHSLTMSSISQMEWATAEKGLNGYEVIGTTAIQDLSEAGELPQDERPKEVTELFKLPLEEFLPEETLHAFDEDERKLVTMAIRVQSSIGRVGVESDQEFIAGQAANGYRDSVLNAPPTIEGNAIRGPVFDEFGSLLLTVAEHDKPRQVRRILSIADHCLDVLFSKDAEVWVYRDILLRYFGNSLRRTQEILLEHHAEDLSETDIDWRNSHYPAEYENTDVLEAFFKWRESFLDTSTRVIRYYQRNGTYPLTEGNLYSAWVRVCNEAADSEANEYAIVLIELFIETAYEASIVDDESVGVWASRGDMIKSENEDHVKDAFNDLRKEGRTGLITGPPIHTLTKDEDQSLRDKVSDWVTKSDVDFEDWLNDFEDEVLR